MPQFEVIEEPQDKVTPLAPRGQKIATDALLLALKALSQRALAATRDIFTLLSVGSVWWLWNALPDPSPTQITSLSIYALFVLVANVIVRKV